MNLNTLIEIGKLTKNKKFKDALNLINQSLPLTSSHALKIVISTVTACGDCLPKETLDENGCILLLESVVPKINDDCEATLLPYCQAIYHISRYFVEKKSFFNLTRLLPTLISNLLKESEALKTEGEVKSTFSSLMTMLSNSILKLSSAKNEKYNEHLVPFAKIIFQASNIINSKTQVLKSAAKTMQAFTYLQLNPQQLFEFYQFLLELVNLEAILENIDIFLNILDFLTYFTKNRKFPEMRLMLYESKLFFEDETWKRIHHVYDILLICSPDRTMSDRQFDKWKTDLYSFKKENSKLYNKILEKIIIPLYYILNYYREETSVWTNLSKESFAKILHTTKLFVLDCSATKSTTPCNCDSNCINDTNLNDAMKRIFFVFLRMAKEYLNKNKECPKDIYLSLLNCLRDIFEMLDSFKTLNCSKLDEIWYDTVTFVYNIALTLYYQENSLNVKLFKTILKSYFKYDGKQCQDEKDGVPESCLKLVCQSLIKLEEWESAMTFSAFFCLKFPNNRSGTFTNGFLRPKSNMKHDPDKEHYLGWTSVYMLEKNREKLIGIIDPNFIITNEQKVDLLCFELRQYKAKYASKLPMMVALKELSDLADCETLAKIVFEIYGDGTVPVHDDIGPVFSKIRKRLETEPNSKNVILQLGLATLHYYKYKTLSRNAANKNIEAMERTMMMEKKETAIEGIPKDAHDECDIVSAYEDLRFNILTNLLDALNQALASLLIVAKTGLKDVELAKVAHTLSTLIGFEYRIHCFGIKSLQSFETSLLFANTSQNEESQLISLSFLIEHSDVDNILVKDLINKADNLEKTLLKNNQNNNYDKTLIIYYICKGKAFLNTNNTLSYDACQKAEVLIFKSKEKEKTDIDMLKAEWLVLMFKVTQSCNFKGEHHIMEPMTTKLHKANDIVIGVAASGCFYTNMDTYQQCIFFDVVMELGKTYYLMKLPRDLRCYSKNSILLAQKLVLPLRCVSFLVYLAHSDLLCCKFDHCNVKINGINDIFCLDNRQTMVAPSEVKQKQVLEIKSIDVEDLNNRIQELALDVPKKHYRQQSPGSPSLAVEGFKAPAFLSHEALCDCFSCICIEHHILLLEKIRLDALLSSYQKQHKIAGEFFQGAITLYNKLKNNFFYYKKKSESLISADLINNFENRCLETYGNILLDYSFHLVRTGYKAKALGINLELLQVLYPKKVQLIHLYSEALLQRASYLLPEPIFKTQVFDIDNNSSKIGETSAKTPESKRSKAKASVSVTPYEKMTKPKRRLKKVTLFENLTMDKDTTEVVATPNIDKTKPKKPNFFGGDSTPMLQDNVFFATPKVQIFTDKKKTSKSQKILNSEDTTNELSSKKFGQSSDKVTKKTTKTVPSIKKNLMSEWSVPGPSTRTKIKKSEEIKTIMDSKQAIKIYSDLSEKSLKPKKSSTRQKEATSLEQQEAKSKLFLPAHKDDSDLFGEDNTDVFQQLKGSSIENNKKPKTYSKREKPKPTDDIKGEMDVIKISNSPIKILAGCSASKPKKKKEIDLNSNLKLIKKSLWDNPSCEERKVNLKSSCSNKKSDNETTSTSSESSLKENVEKNIESNTQKINSMRIKTLQTESNSSKKLKAENKIDIKAKVLTEKIKASSRLRSKKELTESEKSSYSCNEPVRKSSRNRVL